MTSRAGVDGLLDDRARIIAQRAALESHLWAAEFLLHRVAKLLPHMLADSAHNAVHRDTLLEEIAELLAEDRPHPGAAHISTLLAGAAGDTCPPEGTGEQGGTT